MAFSPLCCKYIPAYEGNYTKNRSAWGQDKISEICIHYMAGNLSIETCGQIWQTPGRNGSSTYGIGSDGRIACYVPEEDIAWCNSNWDSNVRSASIETANLYPDSKVTDEALNSLIKLVADIAKRNGMGKLVKGKNLTWHKMYYDTSCIPIDSELLTKNGWKKLEDIEIGDDCENFERCKATNPQHSKPM